MSRQPVVEALAGICAKYPLEEKLLIVPDYSSGHQILENLARNGVNWINLRVTTIQSLAGEIAQDEILRKGLQLISSAGVYAITDGIFNDKSDELKYFRKHAVGEGVIRAVSDAVIELRTNGINSININGKASNTSVLIDANKQDDIILILSEYEKTLVKTSCIDVPGMVSIATERFKKDKTQKDRKYIILSKCHAKGLEREFMENLAGGDLIVISEGRMEGFDVPRDYWDTKGSQNPSPLGYLFYSGDTNVVAKSDDVSINLFHSAGTYNEVREVLRRIMSEGIPADNVEIIHTDYQEYVPLIYSQCEKLGIPVTFGEGLPAIMTSPARALTGFLNWIGDDFAEIHLRRILESGDLKIENAITSFMTTSRMTTLAHLLRTSLIGWGKDRYSRIIESRIQEVRNKKGRYEEEDSNGKKEYLDGIINNLESLKKLCGELIALCPETDGKGCVDFKELCKQCEKFIDGYANIKNEPDAEFVEMIKNNMRTLAKFCPDSVSYKSAVNKILSCVRGIRTGKSGPVPGALYVNSYKRGGRSGRKNTFVVGLDETRFPGRGIQDPILLDEEREKLGKGLALSEEKTRKNLYDMAGLLSGLRGRVTVSYSAYDIDDERRIFPSSLLLQVFRVKEGNPNADYEDLINSLGEPVSFSACSGENDRECIALDETDFWLNKLAKTPVVKNGAGSALKVYPWLGSGLQARESRMSESFTEYDGKVEAGPELDPRKNRIAMSCSRIETIARCPYKYFMRYVLGIEPPDETAKDLFVWLDAMQKGTLLHEVFQKYGEQVFGGNGRKIKNEETLISEILEETIKKYKEEIPPPSEVVFRNECSQLRRDTGIFLQVNERIKTKPVYFELSFGMEEGSPPVEISVGEKKILLRGMVDRVDKEGEHTYHVWDYKTGSSYGYSQRGRISKGQQLQHVLYSEAVTQILRDKDKKAVVTKSGYILPTEKGANSGKGEIFGRDTIDKEYWQGAVNVLFDVVSDGAFIPAPNGLCAYCDYLDACDINNTKNDVKIKTSNPDNKELDGWRSLEDYE